MFLASRLGLVAMVCAVFVPSAIGASALRVCADPNNLPYSNERQQGFENRIADLVARDLGRPTTYVWWPQRRGFLRSTLLARRCDVVVGTGPAPGIRTTQPYYRSTYTFVSRRSDGLQIDSFDDERLRRLTIGIQITGDDYANPPAAQALAFRGLTNNVRGFTVYGDYSRPDPQRDVVDAVASRAVDVSVVWGPLAGYYATRQPVALEVTPIHAVDHTSSLRFAFDVAMGVRSDDVVLHAALDRVIAHRRSEIRRILESFGVPLL
jgi:mxaJ protein